MLGRAWWKAAPCYVCVYERVCWMGFGQLVYVDVFWGPPRRFCGGFRVAPAPDSQRVWALSAPTHPRRRTPIWAGGAQGEAWLSGCAEGRKLKGTCCFDSAFDWWRLATDRYALKTFQWCSYTSEKSNPHTHTHMNRQTVWSGVSELSPGWRISLREANTPLFLRRLIISAEKQRQNTTWSECMHSKWTKTEISPCSTSTNPFAQSSVVSWKGVRTITILKRFE